MAKAKDLRDLRAWQKKVAAAIQKQVIGKGYELDLSTGVELGKVGSLIDLIAELPELSSTARFTLNSITMERMLKVESNLANWGIDI